MLTSTVKTLEVKDREASLRLYDVGVAMPGIFCLNPLYDIVVVEAVQKRLTRPNLEERILSCQNSLSLFSLELRRVRSDLI